MCPCKKEVNTRATVTTMWLQLKTGYWPEAISQRVISTQRSYNSVIQREGLEIFDDDVQNEVENICFLLFIGVSN